MPEKSEHLTTLFIRDEKNWQICFQRESVEGFGRLIQQKRANGDTHSKNCKTAAWPRRSKCPSEKATDQRKVYYDWWPIEESSLIRQAFEICNRRFEALFQRPAGLPSERLFRQADVGLTLSWIVVG